MRIFLFVDTFSIRNWNIFRCFSQENLPQSSSSSPSAQSSWPLHCSFFDIHLPSLQRNSSSLHSEMGKEGENRYNQWLWCSSSSRPIKKRFHIYFTRLQKRFYIRKSSFVQLRWCEWKSSASTTISTGKIIRYLSGPFSQMAISLSVNNRCVWNGWRKNENTSQWIRMNRLIVSTDFLSN